MSKQAQFNKHRVAGLLVAMGVVYGDIGTSPLYVMKAIITGQGGMQAVDEKFMLGAVSLVFWTMTLLTTVKYVLIALNADNRGGWGANSRSDSYDCHRRLTRCTSIRSTVWCQPKYDYTDYTWNYHPIIYAATFWNEHDWQVIWPHHVGLVHVFGSQWLR